MYVYIGTHLYRHTIYRHIVLQNLEDRDRKHIIHKEQLSREHRFLRRRLEQLTSQTGLHGLHALHGLHGLSTSAPTGSATAAAAAAAAAASAAMLSKRRSISECSLGTVSTSSTGSSINSDRSAGSPSVSESGEYDYKSMSLYTLRQRPVLPITSDFYKSVTFRRPSNNLFLQHYIRFQNHAV